MLVLKKTKCSAVLTNPLEALRNELRVKPTSSTLGRSVGMRKRGGVQNS
jgi:hypothetical protein